MKKPVKKQAVKQRTFRALKFEARIPRYKMCIRDNETHSLHSSPGVNNKRLDLLVQSFRKYRGLHDLSFEFGGYVSIIIIVMA